MISEEKFFKELKNIICAKKEMTMDDSLQGPLCIWDSLAVVSFLDIVEDETGVSYDMPEDRVKFAETPRALWEYLLWVDANKDEINEQLKKEAEEREAAKAKAKA